MPITPAGQLSLHITRLRTLIANGPAFISRTDAADADDARTRIHISETYDFDGIAEQRPFAVLWFAELGWNMLADGAEPLLVTDGGIFLRLEDNTPGYLRPDAASEDAYLDFLNFAGSVLDEMNDLSGKTDPDGEVYHVIDELKLALAPRRTPHHQRDKDNDFFETVFLIGN